MESPEAPVRRAGSVMQRLVLMSVCLAASLAQAQGWMGSPAAKAWAWDQVKARTWYLKDEKGNNLWNLGQRTFEQLPYADQNRELLDMLGRGRESRRTALLILGDRSFEDWARPALRRAGDRDEVALFLYHRGFKYPDPKDPFAYLEPSTRLVRPWSHGLGLHLEGPAWRLQWIPSPVLLGKVDGGSALPPALQRAPVPTALLRLRQLRPGLLRLRDLAGGSEGIPAALAKGSRAGFLLRHVSSWLDQASPALGALAEREAWVLHYGFKRESMGPGGGTLVWLPGSLPTRTKLALELLKLNPSSSGARVRSIPWEHRGQRVEVAGLRGSGGLLYLWEAPEGVWLSDAEAPLRMAMFPEAQESLGERAEWTRVALAGLRPATEVSLWAIPRLGASAAFERVALRRRMLGAFQQTWANPFIPKAAPRGGTLALALGAGPTETLLASILRVDQEGDLPLPQMAAFADEGKNLSEKQKAAYQAEVNAVNARNQARKALRTELGGLLPLLDLRGAALSWSGWTEVPPGDARQKPAARYGGFGDPGLTPSLALALPVQAGKQAALEGTLKALWPRLFRGTAEKRPVGAAELHRIRTVQAFRPCYALAADHLVVGTDDKAVASVAAGLLGQAPTLADSPSQAFGRAEVDGPALAKDAESLLLAYLRGGGWSPVQEGTPATAEDAAAVLADTFGPFLGAVRALGRQTWVIESTAAGFEVRPQ